jgi:N-acetylglucosamine malate deacetylase 2
MRTKKKKAKKAADAIPLGPAVKNHHVVNNRITNPELFQMKILYIFPHPDDESFGPAGAIHSQVNAGHEVHLLTLTKGGATQARHKLNLTIAQMGGVRFKEMQKVQKVLSLTSMTVLDYEDSNLKELDPRT